MAYTVHIAGECDPGLEHELADALSDLLSDPEFGVSASQMGGVSVNGPVHFAPPEKVKAKDAGVGDS